MRKKELSKTEKLILQHIALKGPKTEYDIFAKDKIASPSTVHYADRKLRKLGYIEIKETRSFRRIPNITKNYLGLTFKGLHYCLLKGLVNVKDAQKLMGKHEIELPPLPKTEFIETNPNFKALKHVVNLFRYEDLPKVAGEFIGLFPLDFFSGLKRLSFEEYETEVEYNGLIYMGIFASMAITIFLDPGKHKMMMTETKYMREYFRKVWENLRLLEV